MRQIQAAQARLIPRIQFRKTTVCNQLISGIPFDEIDAIFEQPFLMRYSGKLADRCWPSGVIHGQNPSDTCRCVAVFPFAEGDSEQSNFRTTFSDRKD